MQRLAYLVARRHRTALYLPEARALTKCKEAAHLNIVYTININGAVLDGRILDGSGGSIQYIVDSGTTLNYFPDESSIRNQ